MRTIPQLRTAPLLALLLALPLVAGCGGDEPIVDPAAAAGTEAAAVETAPAPAAPPPDTATEEELGSPQAAVAVVVEYYQAIARGDFETAYRQWADDGVASGQSFAEFRSGFAGSELGSVEVGRPGRIEPAAGSRYVEVPVEVGAISGDGSEQCFEGTFTLRRAVVPGATAEQRRWRFDSAEIAPCAPSADGGPQGEEGETPAAPDPQATAAATALVASFGERMDRVSLLAPAATLATQIRTEYGPLVTPALLARWLAEPTSAPGREVSSPWPERIEVQSVTPGENGALVVAGEVVHVTSVEQAAGGAARREPVALTVIAGDDGGWRIADYRRR